MRIYQIILKWVFILFLGLSFGCAGHVHRKGSIQQASGRRDETPEEAQSALKTVVEAISQKPIDDQKLKELGKQIEQDESAQSAIESITETMAGKEPKVKYSPVTGKRYSSRLEFDPETGVRLEPLED